MASLLTNMVRVLLLKILLWCIRCVICMYKSSSNYSCFSIVYIFPCFVRIIQHFVCFRLSWGVDDWLISFLIRWFPSSTPLFVIVLVYRKKKMNRKEQKQFHYQVCQIFLQGKYVLTAKVISISFLAFFWSMSESEYECNEAAFWLKALRNNIKYVINWCINIAWFFGCGKNPGQNIRHRSSIVGCGNLPKNQTAEKIGKESNWSEFPVNVCIRVCARVFSSADWRQADRIFW